jgi:hypothetical protein
VGRWDRWPTRVASGNVAGRLPGESRMRENLMSGLGRGSRKRGEGYRACSLLHSQDMTVEDREVEASARLAWVFDASMIDALVADAMASGTPTWGCGWGGEPDDEGGG